MISVLGNTFHRGLGWNEIGLRGREVHTMHKMIYIFDLIFIASMTVVKVAIIIIILSEIDRPRVRIFLYFLIGMSHVRLAYDSPFVSCVLARLIN